MSIRRIERKKRTVYVVEAYAPYRSKTVYSETAARKLEATWLLHPIERSPGKMTMATYLTEWLDEHDAASSTLRGYRNIIVRHLIPELGTVRLAAFSSAHWRTYRAAAARNGHVRNREWNAAQRERDKALEKEGKPLPKWTPRPESLSARTILQHYHVLHRALDDAHRAGMLAQHPLDHVRAPKPERGETSCFAPDELATLVRAVAGDDMLRLPVLLAAGLGLRRGEVLGLRWRDVDLKAGIVTVRHALDYSGGSAVLKQTKAGNVRVLKCSAGLAAELNEHRTRQKRLRLAHADIWVENDLVCCSEDGRPHHPDTLTKAFSKKVRSLKMRHVTFHGLRHSHATMLLAAGVPMKDASARMGHGSINITVDLYGHVLPQAEAQIAGVVETVLGV